MGTPISFLPLPPHPRENTERPGSVVRPARDKEGEGLKTSLHPWNRRKGSLKDRQSTTRCIFGHYINLNNDLRRAHYD